MWNLSGAGIEPMSPVNVSVLSHVQLCANHALDDDANKLIFLGCDSQQKFFHDLNIVSFYNVHYQYQGYYKRDFCWEGGWI